MIDNLSTIATIPFYRLQWSQETFFAGVTRKGWKRAPLVCSRLRGSERIDRRGRGNIQRRGTGIVDRKVSNISSLLTVVIFLLACSGKSMTLQPKRLQLCRAASKTSTRLILFSYSRPVKGFFERPSNPSLTSSLPSTSLPEARRNKDTGRTCHLSWVKGHTVK